MFNFYEGGDIVSIMVNQSIWTTLLRNESKEFPEGRIPTKWLSYIKRNMIKEKRAPQYQFAYNSTF